jgi:hypothetical protein
MALFGVAVIIVLIVGMSQIHPPASPPGWVLPAGFFAESRHDHLANGRSGRDNRDQGKAVRRRSAVP